MGKDVYEVEEINVMTGRRNLISGCQFFCWTESMAEGGYGGIKKDKKGGLMWEKRLPR